MVTQDTAQSRGAPTDTRGTRLRVFMRFGIAVGAITLALLLTLAFRPLFVAIPASLFFLAIIGSAWYGGVRTGLLATLCATAALDYFFISPVSSLTPQVPDNLEVLSSFVIASLTVSLLMAAHHQAEAVLHYANQTLEQ